MTNYCPRCRCDSCLNSRNSIIREMFRKHKERVSKMTQKEALQELIDMGMYTKDGVLHENYGGPKSK